MRKNVRFFSCVAAMLLTANIVFAQRQPIVYQDFKTVEVITTDEWIEIDGLEDEACWSKVPENPVGNILRNWGAQPVENIWGYSATFKVVRDVNYFYFFVKVKDNVYIPYDSEKMKSDIGIDHLELFFFPNPDDKNMLYEEIDARPRGLSQLRVSIGNTENRFSGGGYAAGFAVDNKITGYEYKTVQTADGYNAEIVIPKDIVISEEYYGNLEIGKKILFDINTANCTDYESNTRQIILGWSGIDYNSWKLNSTLGEMHFVENLSSVEKAEMDEVNYSFTNNILSLQDVQNAQIRIHDISGKMIKSWSYTEPTDLSSLTSGIYLVNVEGMKCFKIVK